jgi:transcriptional regulator with XRE-family HTH domain
MAVAARADRAGELLREWRRRRSLSQLELATRSAVSTRHLSFIETGRARPSREMLLHLAQRLEIPLRERNRMLLAAGFAPVFGERTLEDPELGAVREALDRFLAAHEPYPAVVLDRHWNVVAANRGLAVLVDGVAPALLAPPANALRLTLHPDGMAPRIANLDEWSRHLLDRLRREAAITGDPGLEALLGELSGYAGVAGEGPEDAAGGIVVLLRLRHADGELRLFSTVTTFGTALDVTLADLTIEAFYPADAETAQRLASLVGPR